MAVLTHLSRGGECRWDPKRQQLGSHPGTSFQDGWKNVFLKQDNKW